MGLNSSGIASTINQRYDSSKSVKDFALFLEDMTKIIDDGFQEASCSADNFLLTDAAGSLNFPVINDVVTPEIIGTQVASYWTKAVTLGTPVSCKNVESVINDASKISSIITSKIHALQQRSAKGIESKPYYKEFIDILFDAVKTITWTIVESDSDCSTTLTGTVS